MKKMISIKNHHLWWSSFGLLMVLVTSIAVAQRGGQCGKMEESKQTEWVPDWGIDQEFKGDVFTFVRIKYESVGGRGRGAWRTDYRDSDLNFSLRLQQLTSLKVDPEQSFWNSLTNDFLTIHSFTSLSPGLCISARQRFRRCEGIA